MIQPELKAYRRCSDRHVLVLETNLTYVEKCQIFHYADLVRKAGNELTGIMKKRYDQLVRTKRYRKLKARPPLRRMQFIKNIRMPIIKRH